MTDSPVEKAEAEMQKVASRMVYLNRLFTDLFERCFERPDLAYEKWAVIKEETLAYEILKYKLPTLGEGPRDERRAEQAVDAWLRLPDVYQEYRGLRNKLDDMQFANPGRFKEMQQQIEADPDPWWVKGKPQDPGHDASEERNRDQPRGWWRER